MSENRYFVILVIALILTLSAAWLYDSRSLINWGFGGYTTTTTSKSVETDPLTNQPKVVETTTIETHPAKTVWDLMSLLIIPFFLVIVGGAFTWVQRRTEIRATKERSETELHISTDRQREAALQSYLDKMGKLLMEKDLHRLKKQIDNPIRKVAQIQTITTLRLLDLNRKNILFQFLRDAGLGDSLLEEASLAEVDLSYVNISYINFHNSNLYEAKLKGSSMYGCNFSDTKLWDADLSKAEAVEADFTHASISGANLEHAWLRWANFSHANLEQANLNFSLLGEAIFFGADLRNASLRNAKLTGADMRGAVLDKSDLTDAKLSEAQLEEIGSLKGATMPDGSIHD